MNTEAVRNMLVYLAAVDPLHSTQSQEKFAEKVQVWTDFLGDVDGDLAMTAIQLHYSQKGATSIKVGDILSAVLRARDADNRARAQREYHGETHLTPPERDIRERRCRTEGCHCSHTECRDGWLDNEIIVVSSMNEKYQTVTRCPTCKEAMMMRAETVGAGRRG